MRPKKEVALAIVLRLPKAGTPSASTPYTLPRVSVSGEKQDAVTHVPGNRTVWSDCFLRRFLRHPRAGATPAANEMPSVIQVPPEAQPSPHFDATAATNAYLAQIPADKTARSDAYFEGGYWLILWDFLYGSAVALLLLNLRWSARMRDLSERVTRFKPVHTFVYFLQYLVLTSILIFRSRFTKTISASTNMASPPRPSAPGWPISSRISA